MNYADTKEMWENILAGKMNPAGPFSRRAIRTLEQLSQSEVRKFRRFGSMCSILGTRDVIADARILSFHLPD